MGTNPAAPAQPVVPAPLRVCAFVDGYNLFMAAKKCFGYDFPNYEILRLVNAVVAMVPNRRLVSAHFYVGIPRELDDQRTTVGGQRN